LRENLRSFNGIGPIDEPQGFCGQLRDYQKSGLGWLGFLQEFRLGGCLADDMGLGKTIQVLAMLQQRRARPIDADGRRAPSLAVVPRSLVFNWIEEAKRFTPELRVLDYTGIQRRPLLESFDQYDLIVTTYGTMQRDIVQLKDIRFDCAILDESQAIKNAHSQRAKASRLLRASHRLAMTGTPVENHLGELWSLLEFLNPGMLGTAKVFQNISKSVSDDDEGLALLRRALGPFILRRTKQQVLTELPPKTEQTLHCDLEGKQRKRYDELRTYYRAVLADRIAKSGMNQSKIHVLEALLRLRQAAIHPGLIDKDALDESSAKLDVLMEQLREVIDEGHKALVFSQFTSFLAIVRKRIDREKWVYEYLDGRTRQRQERVERFQNDPECPLFLISLKAGGHGLNLTAADYVFILDPWWNPAVEAQAIDRAHRIGQDRHVFAYRLIARDTVEEKIIELQQTKRDLAEAIISADGNVLSRLTAEDLELLLS
jgi:SNF2 family DNA or RNA helicase